MIAIPEYQVIENLYESSRSVVYRARRERDDLPVILKVLKEVYPPPEKIAWFKREYEITHNLDLPGVVRVYDLRNLQHRWVMILEDFGGDSLSRLVATGKSTTLLSPLSNFLQLAARITDTLGQIHQHNIIHKDVNPANIVFNPATAEVKLIDFGIATILSRESHSLNTAGVLEGTLPYISPEQTGRTNRAVDYRTDFYSLGATLYELLTGQPPFPALDAMELVHSHIAKQPPPPRDLDPDIPQAVSDIILKLLAKNAEDRYQSAYGIKADLEECLRQWEESGAIAPFTLGQRDVSDKFHIPQKLYGRDDEIAALHDAFGRVKRGVAEMMLISGPAGIGKTALGKEPHGAVAAKEGYFAFGRFDQLQNSVPYSALIEAFQTLVQQILTERETEIAVWREELLTALGPNGQLIIEVIPEVELIIGEQPEVTQLPPAEAQNRFNLVFQNFIRAFTQPQHPLAIFLDGLQWADAASLNLLKLVMTAPDTQYLLLIGAYRDTEVDASHPLMQVIEEIRQADAKMNFSHLSPLKTPIITRIIANTLNCSTQRAAPLAKIVTAKTRGNPFFMTEFLKSLHAEEILKFDYRRGEWQWNLKRARAHSMTDNVIELLVDKVRKLEPESQEVLKLAACIGNQFDLQTLASVHEQSPQKIATALERAMAAELIHPLDAAYKLVEVDTPDLMEEMTVEYRFAHNRVRQAVYSLLSAAQRNVIHRQLGQLLLQNTAPEEREERIFDIVNHLNTSAELLDSQSERDELAKLNLAAGRKASDAVAYETAHRYLQRGISLLEDDSWQRQYELTLDLHVEATETAHLNADFALMERLAEIVLNRAATLLGKVRVYETLIQAHIAQNKPLEALRLATMVLDLLGVSLPEKPNRLHIMLTLLEMRVALFGTSIEGLAALPRMTEPRKLAAVRLISSTGTAAYIAAPDLAPLLIFKQIKLSIKHGNAPSSAFAYASYGLILCGVLGDIDAGYRFGQLALKLVEKLDTPELRAKANTVTAALVRHWKEPLREVLPALLEGYRSGIETGDLEFAATAAHNYCSISYLAAKELPKLEQEITEQSAAINRLGQRTVFQLNEMYHQVVLNLRGEAETPCELRGDKYDEIEMLPIHRAATDRNAIYNLHFNKLILCYLFQEYDRAIENLEFAAQYADGAIATSTVPLYNFYESLTYLAIYPDAATPEKRKMLKKVAANQRKMKKWAKYAPENHQHRFYLVEAERARVRGKDKDAREYYDRAIELARDHEYINEQALASELAAKFYLERDRVGLARYYLLEAHYAYRRWGARAKTQDLETRYEQFLAVEASDAAGTTYITAQISTTSSATATSSRSSGVLDVISVIKASQAMSGEIVLDKLLAALMEIVIENAGAQSGYLLFEKKGQWVIEAQGAADQSEVTVLQSVPLTEHPLPLSIINYVAHTARSVVLHDAAREGHFTRDRYIIAQQPQSVLCMPLLSRGKLMAILYLENNLTPGAFTPDHLEILNILSAQAAISIENATLYANMETLVERRTAQLSRTNLQLTQEVAERKRAEQVLQRRVALETLVTIISTDFINLAVEQIDRGIANALQAVGEFADADRCYVFQFSANGTKMSNTHEWCALEIEPRIDQYQEVSVDRWSWGIEKLRRLEDIHVPRMADLPAEAFGAASWAHDAKSLVVVPLVYMGKLKGFLGFDAIREERDWEDDIALLHIVAEMFMNALERHRTAEVLRESQRRLEASYQREYERRKLSDTLREVAKIVSSTLDRQKVLDSILAQLDYVLTYHRATVMLLTENNLIVVAGRDKTGGTVKYVTIDVDKYPINAATLREKYPILLPDVTKDERWRATDSMVAIRSFISAPLLVQEQPIGLLSIGRGDATPYTVEDTQTAFAFASQVAIAMHNAQLYAETQERARRLALLHEISMAVNSTLNLRALLTAACQKLVQNFEVDHSGVLLFDDEYTYGEVAAEYPAQNALNIHIPLEGYVAAERIINSAQPLAIYDAQNDPLMEGVWEIMRDLGIGSILMVPLITKNRVIGTFSLEVTTEMRQFEADEIGLCQTIAGQLATAIENARWLERERNRIEQELKTAHQIQVSLLPSAAPDIPGLEISGISQPARQVGGDFYNYFVFSEEHLGIAVGDVSGKGMEAALMMALSVGLLSTTARREVSPAALLNALNAQLRPHTQRNKMNTALTYITLHRAEDGWTIRGANAGLIEPLLRRRDGTVEWLRMEGMPLGMMRRFEYNETSRILHAGDELILCSDGVIEAMNRTGKIYGFKRLEESVAAAPRGSARVLQEAIARDVCAFEEGAEAHDDSTIVVVRVQDGDGDRR